MTARTDYTAADYLTYLHQSDFLGFLNEQLGFLAECPEEACMDMEGVMANIDVLRDTIRQEAIRCGARGVYSNGVQISRMELYATSEPGEEGEEAPVVAELHHTIHPNGTPVEPSMPGGEWFDTIQKRIG
jgi:hypothetical protein